MALTREEERELRLNSSIGTLLGSLSTRTDLKQPPPPKEDFNEEEDSEGGVKRSAEDQGGVPKKPRDAEESQAIDFYSEETPDFEEDDPEWVVEEKRFLIEEFGRKIVTLSFDEKDRFIYTCEICNVECCQRKMLEAHCNGMKHLKKKNLLERRLQGKDVPDTFKVTKSNTQKITKPSGPNKPPERDPEEFKNKWQSNNYYNYGPGNHPGFYNHPPPFVPPPGPPGFPNGPPPGPPPNYYGPWGPPPPNIFNTPPPTIVDTKKNTGKDSLAGGDTGSLLQKLADCAVKNEKDSELAINVVIALMKSLKDFNHKRGETKFIEVLTEADVTFRVLKTLKPQNKDSDDSAPPVVAAAVADTSLDTNSTATGVSDFVQGTPTSSQTPNYADNNQYYGSQNNTGNNGYSYNNGSNFSSPVPTGVPPPPNINPKGGSGYGQDTSQSYGSNQGYSSQGPAGTTNQNSNYSGQNYSNQGYGSQGYANPSGYSYPGATQTTQSSEDQGGQKVAATNTSQAVSAVPPPPPPPPPPPASTTATTTDNSTPDFSNYGYAAGYSMGYYSVPPPAYTQPY